MLNPLFRSAVALTLGFSLAGCIYAPPPPAYTYNPYDPAQRTAADALIGAGAGAAIGGAAGGGRGAAVGALTGGALGAAVGASSAPPPAPYGYGPYDY